MSVELKAGVLRLPSNRPGCYWTMYGKTDEVSPLRVVSFETAENVAGPLASSNTTVRTIGAVWADSADDETRREAMRVAIRTLRLAGYITRETEAEALDALGVWRDR